MIDEAARNKGRLTGKLRIGADTNSNHAAIGRLLSRLSEQSPDVQVELKHGTSHEIAAGLRNGNLDAGFYNDPGHADPDLEAVEIDNFLIYLAAAAPRSKFSRLIALGLSVLSVSIGRKSARHW